VLDVPHHAASAALILVSRLQMPLPIITSEVSGRGSAARAPRATFDFQMTADAAAAADVARHRPGRPRILLYARGPAAALLK
jgi:hypothetical protein